jgi:hypothetical protein
MDAGRWNERDNIVTEWLVADIQRRFYTGTHFQSAANYARSGSFIQAKQFLDVVRNERRPFTPEAREAARVSVDRWDSSSSPGGLLPVAQAAAAQIIRAVAERSTPQQAYAALQASRIGKMIYSGRVPTTGGGFEREEFVTRPSPSSGAAETSVGAPYQPGAAFGTPSGGSSTPVRYTDTVRRSFFDRG